MKIITPLIAGLSCSIAMSALAQVDVAEVRVFHASPDAPSVDVLVDGTPVFTDLAFTEGTMSAPLFEGQYNIKVNVAGSSATVIDVDLDLEAGTDYSVLAVNDVANIAPFVLVDDNTIDEENARVRFFHASPDAPPVDIFVTDGPELFDNIPYLGTGDYIPVGPGTYDLEVRVADTDTVVLEVPGVELNAGSVYTVIAEGFAFGDDPSLQAVLALDNSIGDLNVLEPFPGLIDAGNGIRAKGARPGSEVFFAASFALGSADIPGCTVALDLAGPRMIGSAIADDLGEAVIRRNVITPRTVYFQAYTQDDCWVSEVLGFTFQ